jgi:Integrase core domain.
MADAAAAAPLDPNSTEGRLAELAQRLGTPGASKLYAAARRRGIRVTKDQVRNFVRTKGQKQLFRPLPPSKGQTASESIDMRYQMDLVDLKYSPSRGNKNILVLVNVFSRRASAVPIKDKSPEATAAGLRALLSNLGSTPVVISSDKGGEFAGRVQELLDQQGIVHRVKADKNDANALAVVDRFIQNLKTRLAESLAETPGEWSDRVPQVVAAYNETPHETLHGEPPSDVRSSKVVQFLLTQDNARKIKGNQTLLEARKKTLEEAGGFRRPMGGLTRFKRGFQASYGQVEQVDNVTGSLVKPTGDGEAIDVKRVLPVDKDTGSVQPGFALGEARTEAKRNKVAALAMELFDWLGDEEKSMTSAARHLRQVLGPEEYRLQLMSVGAQHLSDVVRLFPNLKLTRQGYYLQRQ